MCQFNWSIFHASWQSARCQTLPGIAYRRRDHAADKRGLCVVLPRVLNDLARNARIEVRQDEALVSWESAMNVAPLGYGALDKSREEAWA